MFLSSDAPWGEGLPAGKSEAIHLSGIAVSVNFSHIDLSMDFIHPPRSGKIMAALAFLFWVRLMNPYCSR